MNEETARQINAMTGAFYRHHGASFSQTRQTPWRGWERLLGFVPALRGADGGPLRVLDLGCGNLRFARFLAEHLGEGGGREIYAVDNCDELAQAAAEGLPEVRFRHLDVVETLLAGGDLAQAIGAPPCDLAVAFGLFHHLPSLELRCKTLSALVDAVRPGGIVAVSFWQFLHDERLAAKARPAEELGEHDRLMGWQNDFEETRFCHHFTEAEIDALAGHVANRTCELARYSADGKTSTLNRYLVLQRS